MLYIKRNSGYVRLPEHEDGLSEVIVVKKKQLRVCGVHRPFKTVLKNTSSQMFSHLMKCLDKLASTGDGLIIGGDFNINWNQSSKRKKEISNWSEKRGLIQTSMGITRSRTLCKQIAGVESEITQEPCIDLVFQKSPRKVTIE